MTQKTFRDRVLDIRPDAAERVSANEVKRKLALALRALRKSKGYSQKEVEARSGLAQSMISRLEAPSGALPNWATVMRYVEACDGHMLFGLSDTAFDENAFLRSRGAAGDKVIAAVAV